jgi:hypothetical protein
LSWFQNRVNRSQETPGSALGKSDRISTFFAKHEELNTTNMIMEEFNEKADILCPVSGCRPDIAGGKLPNSLGSEHFPSACFSRRWTTAPIAPNRVAEESVPVGQGNLWDNIRKELEILERRSI